ncbi:MAG: hypothetical protein KAF91_02810 [Nostoc sp. TH1S01]|nr:hypothetical protein [Nostoc sp. TH1S01]
MVCIDIKQELEALVAERTDLQDELDTASPNQKPAIISQIKQLNKQISLKRNELDACLGIENVPPLLTTFTGTSKLTTSYPSAPGPFINSITLGLFFSAGKTTLRSVQITSFPNIVTDPFDTPIGKNVTTVKKISGGGGSFSHSNGSMSLGLTLRFDHSIDFPLFEEDSNLDLVLGTGSLGNLKGSPFNPATRELTLVGMGTFQGGILGGSTGTLIISGKLADTP